MRRRLSPKIIIGDAGYGLPREARPRKEKILAIARQLANFIEWQQQQQQQQCNDDNDDGTDAAQLRVVACTDESVRNALEGRTLSLLRQKNLPSHVSFSCQSLEDMMMFQDGIITMVEWGNPPSDDGDDADDGGGEQSSCSSFSSVRRRIPNRQPTGIPVNKEEEEEEAEEEEELQQHQEEELQKHEQELLQHQEEELQQQHHQQITTTPQQLCYLSPDAKDSLDPCQNPPPVVVVGLLIDRRIQTNRSQERASKLNLVTKRWPLEECCCCFVDNNISANEPLNVDCIMEGMQQWWWNHDQLQQQRQKEQQQLLQNKEQHSNDKNVADRHRFRSCNRQTFVQAAAQAIQHHVERHPSRPVHLQTGN